MTVDSEEVPGPAVIVEEAAADTLVLPVVPATKTDEPIGAMVALLDLIPMVAIPRQNQR